MKFYKVIRTQYSNTSANVLAGLLALLGILFALPIVLMNIGYICINHTTLKTPSASIKHCKPYFNFSYQIAPKNQNVNFGMGYILYEAGELPQSLLILNDLLEKDPSNKQYLLLRATIYDKLDKPGLAINDYEQIGLHELSSYSAHQVRNYLKLSDEKFALGNENAAEELLITTLQWDQDNLYSLTKLSPNNQASITAMVDDWDYIGPNQWNDSELFIYDLRALTQLLNDKLISDDTWHNSVHLMLWFDTEGRVLTEVSQICNASSLDQRRCDLLIKDGCARAMYSLELCDNYLPFLPDINMVSLTATPSGNNLILYDATFELKEVLINKHPVEWRWQPAFNKKWGPGDFRGGTDCHVSFVDQCSMRIQGLWFDRKEEVSWPNGGFVSKPINLQSGCYELSFAYRTSPFVSASHPGINLQQFSQGAEITLPDTKGQWEQYTTSFKVIKLETFTPIFRLWGKGAVWYDQIALEQITC